MLSQESSNGTVYLVHLDAPLGDPGKPHGQARHYLGWTVDLDRRIQEHKTTIWHRYVQPITIDGHQKNGSTIGGGSTLLGAANAAGIGRQVVRVWQGGLDLERRLKAWHNHAQLCPICRECRRQNSSR